jgi:chromosome segregation ATPase
MREQLQRRVEELKKEFNTGRARLAELEQQQTTVQQTLLRISGAIQVLEEELKAGQAQDSTPIGNAIGADFPPANGSRAHVGA